MSREAATIAARFGVYRGEDLTGGVFGEEDFAFLHHGGEAVVVRSGSFQKGLDLEGSVDDGNESGAVGGGSQADV